MLQVIRTSHLRMSVNLALLAACVLWGYPNTVRRKIFETEKFRESLPKSGGRNIRDKNIREGGSDTLRNTITRLLCLCGSSDL